MQWKHDEHPVPLCSLGSDKPSSRWERGRIPWTVLKCKTNKTVVMAHCTGRKKTITEKGTLWLRLPLIFLSEYIQIFTWHPQQDKVLPQTKPDENSAVCSLFFLLKNTAASALTVLQFTFTASFFNMLYFLRCLVSTLESPKTMKIPRQWQQAIFRVPHIWSNPFMTTDRQ